MAAGIPQDSITDCGEPAGDGAVPRPPPAAEDLVPRPSAEGTRRPAGARAGWTAGRVIALFSGSVLILISLGLLGGGGALLWADQAQRQDGYLTTRTATYPTTGYALSSERLGLGWGWLLYGLVGDVRIRVTATDPAKPVFVAIGPADQVSRFLNGARYTTVTGTGSAELVRHYGTAVPGSPERAGIWISQATGAGTQTLKWTAETGDWMVVAMNPDGSAGLTVRADAGISSPWLFPLAIELIIAGVVLGALSAALIVVPIRLAGAGK